MNSTVAVLRCNSYDAAEVRAAVGRGLELLGGLKRYIRADEKIVLKPNLLFPKELVCTHPAVFEAVAREALAVTKNVFYGDSSGFGPVAMNTALCGYKKIADELGLTLADFDNGAMVAHPKALLARQIMIANAVINGDGLINIAKFKSHNLTRFTGAIKNTYGCVPGFYKGQYHALYSSVDEFCKVVVDIASYVKPRLHILDGITAMEGNGPQSGTPRQLNVLLFSTDPVALDVTACRMIGLDPSFVPTIPAAQTVGLGNADPCSITLVGDNVEQFFCPSFKVIRTKPASMPDSLILQSIRRMVSTRPQIIKSKCTRCGRCIESCPVVPKAINWPGARAVHVPVYDYQKCIRCYCCNEMCPGKAIVVRTPLLGRILPFVYYLALKLTRLHIKKYDSKNQRTTGLY